MAGTFACKVLQYFMLCDRNIIFCRKWYPSFVVEVLRASSTYTYDKFQSSTFHALKILESRRRSRTFEWDTIYVYILHLHHVETVLLRERNF